MGLFKRKKEYDLADADGVLKEILPVKDGMVQAGEFEIPVGAKAEFHPASEINWPVTIERNPKMKANIDVASRAEASTIKAGLEDPVVKAMVVIVGALSPLTPKQQKRVLEHVQERLEEAEQQ